MIRYTNTGNNGDIKWYLNWFPPQINWPLYRHFPINTNFTTKACLVSIINRLGLCAPLNYILSHIMEKYWMQPIEASYINLFIIREDLVINKGYIEINIGYNPQSLSASFFHPKVLQNKFPLINNISLGIGAPDLCMELIQIWGSSSNFSVSNWRGPVFFILFLYIVIFVLFVIFLLVMEG